jgi:hypothetical protein
MSKPLLISDCDEVLLHMIVPIHFDLVHGDWGEALRHKHDGTVVERGRVWDLLNGFFDTEMHRQQAIDGAVEAINRLTDVADVVILTNLLDHRAGPRTAQLKAVGIDAPVYTNQGGKGEALGRILDEYKPSVAVFVDDLGHQHDSVGEMFPDVWRLHFVGEPLLWERVNPSKAAHARLDRWTDAEHWIRDRLVANAPAPALEKGLS